ncbi:MAG: hypothetical protein COU40_03490 [Candidatus Moranbacteria bacterium CG10_big_fil_rev_8_21_14_0_10_35_21]|nr:MAG: hypothetical protein COU40_03490 [Candidatus Moranbacteria bacterium CG10_big_fil_rev_8_21_14_0_10_35_21]PJA88756.1 MAG: hypothetical protein CO139_01410 [Candidatus Moranbacteria bacterium CG_4_9_14_3_um_filter_36_9]
MENQDREKNEQIAIEVIREFLAKMGFEGEIEKKETTENESLIFNIQTRDSSFLIGQYGTNLQSLQHLARLLVRKKIEEKMNFIVDVNSYREEKNKSIVSLAHEAAEQAIREDKSIALRPMSSYERRIVHLEILENENVKTESVGEGEERRVIIKPASLI